MSVCGGCVSVGYTDIYTLTQRFTSINLLYNLKIHQYHEENRYFCQHYSWERERNIREKEKIYIFSYYYPKIFKNCFRLMEWDGLCLNVWESVCLNVWKMVFKCLKRVFKCLREFVCLNVWESLRFWMSEGVCLTVWERVCLNVRKRVCLKVWERVSVFKCLK